MPNTDGTDSGLDTNRGSLSPGRTDDSSVASPPGSHTHSPLSTYQSKTKHWSDDVHQVERVICIELPADKSNFGFAIKGGKDKHEIVTVESVVLDGPAARAGLHAGDVIVRINGETVSDKLIAKVNHMIHESMRLGEIELIVHRAAPGSIIVKHSPDSNSFDNKRSMFEQASSAQSTPKQNGAMQNGGRKWHTREMANPAAGRGPNFIPSASSTQGAVYSRPITMPQSPMHDEINVRQHVPLPQLPPMQGNYRVSSLTPERTVGKLSDFVPESERQRAEQSSQSLLTSSIDCSPRRSTDERRSPVGGTVRDLATLSGSIERDGLDPLLTRDRYMLIRQQASAKPNNNEDRLPRAVIKNKTVLKSTPNTSMSSPLVQSTAPVRQAVAKQAMRQQVTSSNDGVITSKEHTSAKTTTTRLTDQLSSQEGENMLSVSGKQKCSHCGMELGKGAAMIIESLQLFYHLHCFKCCVCSASLGNGKHGADVRVRGGKLHCHACYSNDDAGWQYSEV